MTHNENRKRFEAKTKELDVLVAELRHAVKHPVSSEFRHTLDTISQLEARLIELSLLHALDMVDMMELRAELAKAKKES